MVRIKLEDGRTINFQGTPTQEDIDEAVATLPPLPKEPTGSLSLLRPRQLATKAIDITKEEFGSAAEDIQGAQQRQEAGEQGFGRTVLTTVAQGSQAGLTTAFRGGLALGSALLPDFIENPLRRKFADKFDEFIESPTGQNLITQIKAVGERFDTLDPKNKQLVRDIGDAVMTGVDLASFGVGGKVVKRGLAEAGAKATTKGEEIITRSSRDQIESARGKIHDMIIDETTPTKRAALAGRTQEGGFFSGRTVKPTVQENKIVDELLITPNIKAARSALFNLNTVVKEVEKEATGLVEKLKKDNFIFPKKEAVARLTSKLEDLKQNDTDIIGDAEQLADRVFAKMRVFLEDNSGTGLGALYARQGFDKWVKAKKPKAFEKQDAFNTAVTSARDVVNDFLVEKAKKAAKPTDVTRALERQTFLIRASDVLKVKAGKEAETGFGRLMDSAMAVLGRKNQIVQLLAALVGIGGLGAAATFAPAVAGLGIAGGGILGLLKLLNSPASRKKLGQILVLIGKALPKAKGEQKEILEELQDEIKALLDRDVSLGLSIEDVSKKGGDPFKNFTDLSTKLLGKLEGRTTVSKQFISDLTNSPDLKQPERDLFRELLKGEGDTVNVKDFANKVKSELLPLKRTPEPRVLPQSEINRLESEYKRLEGVARRTQKDSDWKASQKAYLKYEKAELTRAHAPRAYESTTLPAEIRGEIDNYSEHVYSSPIKTSAGSYHSGLPQSDSYFAHSRVENLPDKFTRRVIEIQSDLFQKGRLETSVTGYDFDYLREMEARRAVGESYSHSDYKNLKAALARQEGGMKENLAKLEPYRNTWHERIIREEIKQAAKDGKTKLQFPTGETALKIEGLGERNTWSIEKKLPNGRINPAAKIEIDDLKVGQEIEQNAGLNMVESKWIITRVGKDGQFKAIPKQTLVSTLEKKFIDIPKDDILDFIKNCL